METLQLSVPGISCGHCVETIERALGALPGVETVRGEVATKQVTVAFGPPASPETIVAALVAEDYPPAP